MTDIENIVNAGTDETSSKTTRKDKVQRSVNAANLLFNGKLICLYADTGNKSQIIGIPRQKCNNITEFYPLDLHYMFQEIRSMMDGHRVRSYTTRIHQKDWDYSPHIHFQISLPRFLYDNILQAIGLTPLPVMEEAVIDKPDMLPEDDVSDAP